MAFPLLFPLLASGGLLLRASPHIFRYLAPKAVTGANRLGQLITKRVPWENSQQRTQNSLHRWLVGQPLKV